METKKKARFLQLVVPVILVVAVTVKVAVEVVVEDWRLWWRL